MRKPFLYERESKNITDMEKFWDLSSELGLEMEGHTSNEFGLKNLTKQNLSKDAKSLDVKG